MKQLIQSLNNGEIYISDLPSPSIKKGHLLVSSNVTLISSGTERMLLEFGKANWINKAKKQPEKVKQVIEKVKTDGFQTTFNSVKNKIDQPITLGYNNVGTIIGIGEGVEGFKIGQRVVSNGAHAEIVVVPKQLCAIIPEEVDNNTAAFTILSSIGLQGIRLANPTIGETVFVIGLGLIGMLTAQLLLAQGCKVLGLDTDNDKCQLAESFGIKTISPSKNEDPYSWCLRETNGIGVDAVLITASTASNEPIDLAARVSRQRGRIILIGVTGLNLKRDLFYKKELTFQVSCSYGPGRYDKNYEEFGQDYPLGFVRWTEKRNFEAVLQLMKLKKIKTEKLISNIFSLDRAIKAYDQLLINKGFGLLIEYKESVSNETKEVKLNNYKKPSLNKLEPKISWIGAGNYSRQILLPAFKKSSPGFQTIASLSGLSPVYLGKKYNFNKASTDIDNVISDVESNTIIITTQHNSHADLIIKALNSGKHVFTEKPLCLTSEELNKIQKLYENLSNDNINKPILMVGFNRRFSPLTNELKKHLEQSTEPKAFVYTCNTGSITKESWIHDPFIGGGRLLGEACHFVDLLLYLSQSEIKDISLNSAFENKQLSDIFTINIKFKNGSIGSVNYLSNGSRSFPKEKLQVFNGGKIYILDNFRKLRIWGSNGLKNKSFFKQNKGQNECAKAFLEAIRSGSDSPIPIKEIFSVQSSLLSLLNK